MNTISALATLSTAFAGFLATYGLLTIFAVMLLKEAGIPLPVPSDLVMLTAGIQLATRAYPFLALLLAVEVAVVAGGSLQFLLVRTIGRQVMYRFGRFVGLTPARLDQAGARLAGRGALAIAVGLNIPGARAGITPAAGLAGVRYRTFIPALIAGSTLFYGWHVALGYLLGPAAIGILGRLHLPLGWLLVALAVLGLVVWLALRRRKRPAHMPQEAPQDAALDRLEAWTHAACPVCLAATTLQVLAPGQPGAGSVPSGASNAPRERI